LRQRNAQNKHTAIQPNGYINDQTRIPPTIFTSLNFTSLHFTALHYTSLPIFSFPFTFGRFVTTLPFTFPQLYNYFLTLFLKICDLQRKVAGVSVSSWFHSLIVLLTEEYLPVSVLCFCYSVHSTVGL